MAGTVDTKPLVAVEEFPTLVHTGVAYLDSSATSQTPVAVLDAMDRYYRERRASVHRGVYPLAAEATELFEAARERAAAWLGWDAPSTVFTRNATEALNLVAQGWGREHVEAGDRIVVTESEHHSSFVPLWRLARERGATLEVVGIDDDGELRLDELDAILAKGAVKLVACVHVSNVLGTINPVAEVVRRAREAGAVSVIDGTQAVPQIPVDLRAIDADFYAWIGHKAYGPTGIGVLHGRAERLRETEPLISGGHMISRRRADEVTWGEVPAKFEAGTSNIAECIGLVASVDFLSEVGMDHVREHARDVVGYAVDRLLEV